MGKPNIALPKEKIADFCNKWHVRELSLFGSSLREDFGKGSDVDVMVDFEQGTGHSLKEESPVAESDEDKPGVILDYDHEGNLVSLEILDASKRVTQTQKIEFETVERSAA